MNVISFIESCRMLKPRQSKNSNGVLKYQYENKENQYFSTTFIIASI